MCLDPSCGSAEFSSFGKDGLLHLVLSHLKKKSYVLIDKDIFLVSRSNYSIFCPVIIVSNDFFVNFFMIEMCVSLLFDVCVFRDETPVGDVIPERGTGTGIICPRERGRGRRSGDFQGSGG